MSDYEYYEEPDFWTAKAMMLMGGGFVSALAEAWFRGDLSNRRKIRECFSNYFEEYENHGKELFKKAYPNKLEPK